MISRLLEWNSAVNHRGHETQNGQWIFFIFHFQKSYSPLTDTQTVKFLLSIIIIDWFLLAVPFILFPFLHFHTWTSSSNKAQTGRHQLPRRTTRWKGATILQRFAWERIGKLVSYFFYRGGNMRVQDWLHLASIRSWPPPASPSNCSRCRITTDQSTQLLALDVELLSRDQRAWQRDDVAAETGTKWPQRSANPTADNKRRDLLSSKEQVAADGHLDRWSGRRRMSSMGRQQQEPKGREECDRWWTIYCPSFNPTRAEK